MNQLWLSGNVVFDPEIKDFGKGRRAVVLIVATSRYTHKDEDGKWVEGSDYHRVVGKTKFHKIMSRYRKGDPIIVRGQLVYRRWKRQDGTWATAANIWPQQIERPVGRGTGKQSRPLVEDDALTMEDWLKELDGI